MTTTYCQTADVSAFLQRAAFTDSPATTPTATQVGSIINAMEDHIDRYTNSAWRAKVVSLEYHDYKSPRLYGRPLPSYTYWAWDVRDYRWCPFRYRPVIQFSASAGDKIEVWRGGNYVDLVSTAAEGRDHDWWVDYDKGMLYFVTQWPLRERNGVRLTYRYGNATTVPNDIRHACVLLTAWQLASGATGSFLLPEGGSEPGYMERGRAWKEQAEAILDTYWELRPDYI